MAPCARTPVAPIDFLRRIMLAAVTRTKTARTAGLREYSRLQRGRLPSQFASIARPYLLVRFAAAIIHPMKAVIGRLSWLTHLVLRTRQ